MCENSGRRLRCRGRDRLLREHNCRQCHGKRQLWLRGSNPRLLLDESIEVVRRALSAGGKSLEHGLEDRLEQLAELVIRCAEFEQLRRDLAHQLGRACGRRDQNRGRGNRGLDLADEQPVPGHAREARDLRAGRSPG